MARQVASVAGKVGEEDLLIGLAGRHGRLFWDILGKPENSCGRPPDSAGRAAEREGGGNLLCYVCLTGSVVRNADRARHKPLFAKGRASGRDVDYGWALALT